MQAPIAIARLFPASVKIESRTVSRTDEGGEEESWSTRHAAIACQFGAAPVTSEEGRSGGIFVARELDVYLVGDFDDIIESDRATIDGHVYDVIGVGRDSNAVVTALRLEERAP
jgi:hypothetical protein